MKDPSPLPNHRMQCQPLNLECSLPTQGEIQQKWENKGQSIK